MKEWLIEHKLYLGLTVLVAFGSYYYFYGQPSQTTSQQFSQLEKNSTRNLESKQQTSNQEKQPEKVETIVVDVKGAIKQPGVYQSSPTERVNDVINRAGGLTEQGDASQVNFAAHVQDEMVIYVPVKGEVSPTLPPSGTVLGSSPQSVVASSGETGKAKVNLNKAEESELETLPGVGPAKAAAILDYRKQNGSFQSIDDLKKISGIGDKTFEKLKDLITVQ